MAAYNDKSFTLASVSGGNFAPVPNAVYYLRIYPYSTNTYTATSSNGVVTFANIGDGYYRLYNSTGDRVGTFEEWIGDSTPTLDSLTVNGSLTANSGTVALGKDLDMVMNDITFGNNVQLNSLSESTYNAGISANDKFIFCGNGSDDTVIFKNAQVQFDANTSVNYNGGDIAHVNNLQVDSFTENTSNAGLTSNSHAIFSQGIEVYGGGLTSNFYHPVKFSNYVPQCTLAPTLDHHLANKEYVDSFTGALSNLYIPISGDTTHVFTPLNIGSPVRFSDAFPPTCDVEGTNSNQLARNSYVDRKVNSLASSLSAYNQCYQVVRLHYNGICEKNKVATSITGATAISLTAGSAPSSANQKCIVIENLGNSSMIEDWIHNPGNGCNLFTNWVNVIGASPNIKVNAYPFSATITASQIGAIVYENLNFYGISDQSATFENIVFRNCTFEARSDGYGDFYFDFTNCVFENGNSFYGNSTSFINCSGERVYCNNIPVISGTNIIQYYTSQNISIGILNLKDNGTAIETHSLSGTGIISATAMNINSTVLASDGTNLSLGAGLIIHNGLTAGTNIKASAGISSTGNINFSGASTINLQSTNINLTGATSHTGTFQSTGLNILGNADFGGNVTIAKRTISFGNDTGKVGEICFDDNYIYFCTSTNYWLRLGQGNNW